MEYFKVYRGKVYIGNFSISIVETPLAVKILKLLEGGTPVVVTGLHGVGKSFALSVVMHRLLEKGAVFIDLAVETSTFAELLQTTQSMRAVFGVFDALPVQFYQEPEIWAERAVLWSANCGRLMARANYLLKRGHPVAIVLPKELASLCRSELRKFEVVESKFELDIAKKIFLSNSETYCGDDYAEEVVNHIAQFGEGGYYMALEAARSLQYCDDEPHKVVDIAKERYIDKLSILHKSLYASTCTKGRRYLSLISNRHLPTPLLSQVVNYDLIESKIKMIEKLIIIIDKVSGPHKEYIKLLILQNSEELKTLIKPRWYIKAIHSGGGRLYEEALSKAAREVRENCRESPKSISLRLLVKAFVIAHNAFDDLAQAIANLATGGSPCLGAFKKLCRGGVLPAEVVDAILTPQRLSIELPSRSVSGLATYAVVSAKAVDEKSWLEVLNHLYDAAERGRVDIRPFEDYVFEALTRGSPITKKLALAVVETASDVPPSLLITSLLTAVELGDGVDVLLKRYVDVVGDAEPIYKKCGDRCKDLIVEIAIASAKRKGSVCDAIRQLEIALMSVGYSDIVERYRPHKACLESI
ncbi:MAG: ATP-binding protein [Pyrobaculum sp.]